MNTDVAVLFFVCNDSPGLGILCGSGHTAPCFALAVWNLIPRWLRFMKLLQQHTMLADILNEIWVGRSSEA